MVRTRAWSPDACRQSCQSSKSGKADSGAEHQLRAVQQCSPDLQRGGIERDGLANCKNTRPEQRRIVDYQTPSERCARCSTATPFGFRLIRRCTSRRRGCRPRRWTIGSPAECPNVSASRSDRRPGIARQADQPTASLGDQEQHVPIGEHELQPGWRIIGVQRHVGAARLQDAQDANDQFRDRSRHRPTSVSGPTPRLRR